MLFIFALIWSEVRAAVMAGMVFFLDFLANVLEGEGLGGLRGFHFVEMGLILLIVQGYCEGFFGCIL